MTKTLFEIANEIGMIVYCNERGVVVYVPPYGTGEFGGVEVWAGSESEGYHKLSRYSYSQLYKYSNSREDFDFYELAAFNNLQAAGEHKMSPECLRNLGRALTKPL